MFYVLIALAVIVVVFLIVVALQPSSFKVERSMAMNAPADAVFAQVNDFHKWEAWSPWAKMDPNAKNNFAGAPAGKDAVFSWDGNKTVGAGRMTITDSTPPSLIRINLEFFKPMKGTNLTEFSFRPQGSQTQMTWTMTGKKNFISKGFCMFMNMDTMVGGQFEKGLAGIKTIVEGNAK